MAFAVNKKGQIRFGLTGVKGVGDKAVESIIEERNERGPYKSVYDFAQRSNTRSVNRKSYENLVYGGAFDEFGLNRAQFFAKTENGILTGVERLIKYANDYQNTQSSHQSSLFGGSVASYIPEPAMPEADEWPLIEKLKYEKEVIGIYLTGHPLDNYKVEMEALLQYQHQRPEEYAKGPLGRGWRGDHEALLPSCAKEARYVLAAWYPTFSIK